MATARSVLVGTEKITLLPGRAALRERTGELLVSDVHLGKDEAFLRAGRALPSGGTESELEKLSSLLRVSGASRLTILGDLTHHQLDEGSETIQSLHEWLRSHAQFQPRLIHGNHDRHASEQVRKLPLSIVEEPFAADGIDYRHCPPEGTWKQPWIAGHIHPGIVLDVKSDRMKVPIFWVRQGTGLVLPAFGDFTGLFIVTPAKSDSTFAAGHEAVVALPARTRLDG